MNTGQRVLIVEDQNIVQLHLRLILQELGYIVSGVAGTAAEALSSAAEATPDLVLMDIQLPGGRDGIDAARELRERYDIGVVFLTAFADNETVSRAQKINALGYIVKPYTKPQIRAALATAFTKHEELQRTENIKNSLSSILYGTKDALMIADMDGAVRFMNPSAASLTGRSEEDAHGKHLLSVFRIASHKRAAAFGKLMEQAFRTGRTGSIDDLSLLTPNGTALRVAVRIESLTDRSGRRGGLIVLFQKVSEPPETVESADLVEPQRFGAGTRLAIYSHDTFGLGHLQRCLKISRALVEQYPGLSILLVTGSPAVHRFRLPKGVDYVKLPSVRKVAAEEYEARTLGLSNEGMIKLRGNLVLQSIQIYDPHVVLIDHAPLGMKGEILPTLEWLDRNRPACIKMLGLRDVLDDPETVVKHWQRKGINEILRKHYDHILIYGSPKVFDPAAAYRFSPELKSKVFYCNYIRESLTAAEEQVGANIAADGKPLVVVTTGGGDGGELVVGSYVEMLRRFKSKIAFESLILPGPFLEPETLNRLRQEIDDLPARLLEFVTSTSPYLGRADLIVATGGYNTMTQALTLGKKALVIPRVVHRKEQLIRAQRLAAMGLVTLLDPADLTAEGLHESVTTLLADPRQPLTEARENSMIPLNGTERLVEFCGRLRIDGSRTEVAE